MDDRIVECMQYLGWRIVRDDDGKISCFEKEVEFDLNPFDKQTMTIRACHDEAEEIWKNTIELVWSDDYEGMQELQWGW